MRVSTSAYYAWINNPDRPDRRKEESDLKKKIKQIFYEHKQVYGSRRISDALSKLDIKAGRYKVRRLMSELGLKVRYPKLLKSLLTAIIITQYRQFAVEAPNKVSTTDITYGVDTWRLGLCGCCDWFVFTSSRWLGNWWSYAYLALCECLTDGFLEQKTKARAPASFGSWQPICKQRVSQTLGYHDNGAKYEPKR